MGAAETLAADPDFATLHEANPTMSEQLMKEALQKDASSGPVGPMGKVEPREEPLQEGFTEPRSMITNIASVLLPGAWMGQAAKAGYGTLGQLGAAAGANEAITLADRATQPGATLQSTLTPGLSDVAAVATPFVAQAVTHPLSTAKSALAPFAKSSQMGQEAANSVVQLQNAKLGADFDWSVASQEKAKAIAGLDYEQQVASWNTLKAAQVTAKRQAAEDLRTLTSTLKSRNVVDAANWATARPGVPTDIAVRDAFTAADTMAQAHASSVNLPEVTAIKKTIVAQADTLAKQPGGGAKARALRKIATSGEETNLSLTDTNEIIKGLHQDIATLRRQPTRYAQTEANALSKIVDAYETGMTRLENDGSIPQAVRATMKTANTLYLKKRTDEEVTRFMTHDSVTPDASGQPQLDPRAAMKAIDSKGNERMVGYMKKVKPPDGNGKNLYEMTKDTLTQMASVGQAEWEAQRLLTKTGGMAIPAKPTNPLPSPNALPYPHPQGGVASAVGTLGLRAAGAGAGFALGGGTGNPYASIPSAAIGVGAPEIFAKLMQTGWGQRTLLSLVQHQGRTISPALVGLATAAVRAGEPDVAPAPVAPTP